VKILLAGGTGFVGRYLRWRLAEAGHEVLVLTRRQNPDLPRDSQVLWDGKTVAEPWLAAAGNCAAWINLCGEPVADARWTKARKALLTESRLDPTRAMVCAIAKLSSRPKVLINASAMGYYGDAGDKAVDENFSSGKGFLAELCVAWEGEALKASALGVRTVCLRLAAVLGRGGGLLGRLAPVFRLFLGGPLGSGRQWLPWISREDAAGLVAHALQADISGGVNAASPMPVTNRDFCAALGRALDRPSRLRVPALALRLGLGELSSMLLAGQKAVPKKALESGYVFKQPDIDAALRAELLGSREDFC